MAESARRVGFDLSVASTIEITAFYKGESQEKTLLLRLEGAGTFACSPAHVMLGGSGFFFLQIHRDRDDALGYRCQQAGWWSNANHGSIWDSWPIAFSGRTRGHMV